MDVRGWVVYSGIYTSVVSVEYEHPRLPSRLLEINSRYAEMLCCNYVISGRLFSLFIFRFLFPSLPPPPPPPAVISGSSDRKGTCLSPHNPYLHRLRYELGLTKRLHPSAPTGGNSTVNEFGLSAPRAESKDECQGFACPLHTTICRTPSRMGDIGDMGHTGDMQNQRL